MDSALDQSSSSGGSERSREISNGFLNRGTQDMLMHVMKDEAGEMGRT